MTIDSILCSELEKGREKDVRIRCLEKNIPRINDKGFGIRLNAEKSGLGVVHNLLNAKIRILDPNSPAVNGFF